MDTQMQAMDAAMLVQAMDAAASLRQGPEDGYELILTGPMAGTARVIPVSSIESAYYFAGTRVPLSDEQMPVPTDLLDAHGYLPGGHRGSGKRDRVAAAREAMLREVTTSDALQSECAVCLQDFLADETLRAMPCSHAFHENCISQWLRRKAICPLCRCQLPGEENDEDEDQIAR